MKVGDMIRVTKNSRSLRKGDVGMIVREEHMLPTNRKQFGVAFNYNSQGTYPPVKTVLPTYIELVG